MTRQSISLTEPNDDWLKQQVQSKEYASKSELVNDLIRQARRQEEQSQILRAKLELGEKSGIRSRTKADILDAAKARLNE